MSLLFIPVYAVASTEATDPTWLRRIASGLLVTLPVASYVSAYIRKTFFVWVQGTVYVIMGWLLVITALNGFHGNYEIGLILLYSILRSLSP